MSILVPVLLTLLALPGSQGRTAALLQTSRLLEESIRLLSHLLRSEVSCDKMNVTNIFAGDKEDDNIEILCKASTVAWESRSCHRPLEGLYLNLVEVVQRKSTVLQAPCPVAAANTTSLRDFLMNLHRLLQRLVKD
ncbi:interleukin-4 [Athene cunicularia]|uniref:interleukin-4 n=1 Tax=Athene cunicularia TaxID=194338 RepID=UPI000EF685ED|nr:interleukin-4 [Athene cunicularia]